jgi:hypothetical protein
MTPVGQLKALATALVITRLAASRSPEEFRETAVRDTLAVGTLFYLGGLIEKISGYVLDKFFATPEKGIELIKGSNAKTLLSMINPLDTHRIRSFDDIEALKNIVSPNKLKQLKLHKSIVYLIGMVSSIAVLGIFIPWLNIRTTRKQMLEKQNASNTNHFSPALNLTPDPALTTNYNPANLRKKVNLIG